MSSYVPHKEKLMWMKIIQALAAALAAFAGALAGQAV